MAILGPMGDVTETLLTTLATSAVFPTTEPIFEVDVNALLAKTTSERTTKPPVEMDLLLNRGHDSLPDEPDDVLDRSWGPAARQYRQPGASGCGARQAQGSGDCL